MNKSTKYQLLSFVACLILLVALSLATSYSNAANKKETKKNIPVKTKLHCCGDGGHPS